MNDHGYTLSEALTALVMLGLALGGVTQAVHVMSGNSIRLERDRMRWESLAAVRELFGRLPGNLGPFVSETDPARGGFSGDERSMRFACAYGGVCHVETELKAGVATLVVDINGHRSFARLRPAGSLRLQYVSANDGVVSSIWPVRPGIRLGAVELEDGGTPLAVLQLENAQAATCAFNIQIGTCVPPNGADNVRH